MWGTGLHTFALSDETFAVYMTREDSRPAWDLVSFDQGYTEFADTDWPTGGTNFYRLWVARNDATAMAANGVTATSDGARPASLTDIATGIIAFNTEVPGPTLARTPATLNFAGEADGPAAPTQTISVTNVGSGTVNFTVSDDAPWLSVTPTSGTAPQTLTVTADPGALSAGNYDGVITITSAGSAGSPQTVAVDFEVAAPSGKLTIAEENELPGEELAQVTISGAGDLTNLGFARPFSLDAGETIEFCCHGAGIEIDIYRIGWYGGDGWRLVDTVVNTPTTQPAPATIPASNGGTTCAAWAATAEWEVPAIATPGLYVGVFRSVPGPNASYIPFCVRDDARPADIMVKLSDSTWALAYNHFNTMASPNNGKNLYGTGPIGSSGNITTRCHAVTYEKPIITRGGVPQTYWLNAEAPLIRFLERNGYDVTYSASRDWREDGPIMADCGIYISSGHDEYWSVGMRNRWETLRDTGKHLLFMSGNEVFWRTRYDDELGETGTGDVMWCFKDTMDGPGVHGPGEALDPVAWTGTWRDTRWADREPDNELTGTLFGINGLNALAPVIAPAESVHPFWRDTAIETSGGTLGAGLVGFEADHMLPIQPAASTAILAQTDFDATGLLSDENGENYDEDGTLEWGIVAQRYVSDSVVVGFGSCQWAWGLDATHDRGTNVSDADVQQAMINLLADLGTSAPLTLMAGMTLPTPISLDEYGVPPVAGTLSARFHLLLGGEWHPLDLT